LHRTFGLLALSLIFFSCSQSPDRGVTSASDTITPSLVKQHVGFLASDALLGRNTPSPGLDTAAAYIIREFRRVGLHPVNGSYTQRVKLNVVSLGGTNVLQVSDASGTKDFAIKTDFTPFEMTANREVSAPVVFCGYGITAPEYGYDDYAGVDVRGKIVFVLRHEPREEDSSSVFEGKKATDYSNVARKVKIAKAAGAVAVLVATDPLNHTSLTPRGFPWPSLSRFLPKDALPITLGSDEDEKIPVVHVGEQVIARLFGSLDSLRALQASIDGSMRPHSVPLRHATVLVRTSTEIKDVSANNVLAVLEGSDPALKHEFVVVGAHYDHVGTLHAQGSAVDSIYNGADDNASGTSAMMAVAAAFGRSGVQPARSVLFIAFAGEEKGLFGSEYYVRNPAYPLAATAAMVNLDMVGRNGRDSLFVIGGGQAPDLMRLAWEENARVGFTLIDQRSEPGGSDHMSFLKKGVPAIFFFSGLHPDYHQVSDHADLINNDKVAAVAKLAFFTALRLANDPHRYAVTK
jgi:hypothetical protein